jgi:SAM-dependent methyltransferase
MSDWWQNFFDSDYIRLWHGCDPPEKAAAEAEGIWQLLRLSAGSRVLDAPCGYGRHARVLAGRCAEVLGIDLSAPMLERARQEIGGLTHLRYLCHDLRTPLAEDGFDAAYNVFSSIGYGPESDDLAIFNTMRLAVRPGGLVLLDTNHRDMFIATHSRGAKSTMIANDGTLIVQESSFDPIEGRAVFKWIWSGKGTGGQKVASFRLYSATELVGLLRRVGLRFLSAHRGCTAAPFKTEGEDAGGRIALLLERDDSLPGLTG